MPEDRRNRLLRAQKSNTNLLLYKKNPPSPLQSPRYYDRTNTMPPQLPQTTTTTYNYNNRDLYVNPLDLNPNPAAVPTYHQVMPQQHLSSLNSMANASFGSQQMQQSIFPVVDMTPLEREAQHRLVDRSGVDMGSSNKLANNSLANSSWLSSASRGKEKPSDLNRLSNKVFTGNQPTPESPNNPYWFGRAGPPVRYVDAYGNAETRQAAYVYDVRRRRLEDSLENRIPHPSQIRANNNNNTIAGLKQSESNHRNSYENIMKMI